MEKFKIEYVRGIAEKYGVQVDSLYKVTDKIIVLASKNKVVTITTDGECRLWNDMNEIIYEFNTIEDCLRELSDIA